jgi:2-polyprenyl-3-methyl-5-hydroxy-6-metoxy-1,4-benzoquinol methylase
MTDTNEFDLAYANEQLRRSRHPLRRFIKRFYLDHVLQDVHGPAIDFGCGAGQILARLPAGSIGVEINPVLVAQLKASGLNVVAYDASTDDFSFSGFAPDLYKTLVISHVLEHFADSASVIRKIWRACARLGIDTIVAVVPGEKGYASDPTHKTFVTEKYLSDEGLTRCEGFEISKIHYFPGDTRSIGKYLTFHEMKIVYKRAD